MGMTLVSTSRKSLSKTVWIADILHFVAHDKQYSQYYFHPLDGSIDQNKALTMKRFKFHLATGLLLVHSHTYMVTRDALPLSHVQTIHHKYTHTSTLAQVQMHIYTGR